MPRRSCPIARIESLLVVVALGLVTSGADAGGLRYNVVSREAIERRLGEYAGTNVQRGERLAAIFAQAGCGGHLYEQPVKSSKAPNVVCILPGSSDRILIVGAHFDRVPGSLGVADNWSGAALLPSLYESLNGEPRRHTYIFVGFTDEELGLVGSRFYARTMTREQVARTDAMINMDTLGLAPTEVWFSRSDKKLVQALGHVANHMKLPLSGVNFERVGSTDSESFRARKIPRITIHTLTQKTEDDGILHGKKDKLSAMNLDYYYDTYRLMAVYLVFLDHHLGAPEAAAPATP